MNESESAIAIIFILLDVCVIVLYPHGVEEYTALQTARELIQEEQA